MVLVGVDHGGSIVDVVVLVATRCSQWFLMMTTMVMVPGSIQMISMKWLVTMIAG